MLIHQLSPMLLPKWNRTDIATKPIAGKVKGVYAHYKDQLKRQPKVVNQTLAIVDPKTDFQLQWALNILEGKALPVVTKVKH